MFHYSQGSAAQTIKKQKKILFNMPAGDFSELSQAINFKSLLKETLPVFRERIFTPLNTLHLFLKQVLSSDKSCQQTTLQFSLEKTLHHNALTSINTAAYCKARKRLPTDLISGITRSLGRHLYAHGESNWKWCERSVKLVDACTVTMPDTLENQAEFPQISAQKPGLGFPIARLLTVICLSTGAVIDAEIGNYNTSEPRLMQALIKTMNEGDIVVGDRLYGSYFMIALLKNAGVDSVMRMHACRKYDFRKGKRLGKHDHLVILKKPNKPNWLDQKTYDQLPHEIQVRELKKGNIVITTTLLDKKTYTKNKMIKLYRDRWNIEVDLRCIKQIMQMDILRCKTPDMIRKEIWMHLFAYNFIRLMIVQAARLGGKVPRKLSFKNAAQACAIWISISRNISRSRKQLLYQWILYGIYHRPVGNRPGRREPRVVKRRAKPHHLMLKPRAVLKRQLQLRRA